MIRVRRRALAVAREKGYSYTLTCFSFLSPPLNPDFFPLVDAQATLTSKEAAAKEGAVRQRRTGNKIVTRGRRVRRTRKVFVGKHEDLEQKPKLLKP